MPTSSSVCSVSIRLAVRHAMPERPEEEERPEKNHSVNKRIVNVHGGFLGLGGKLKRGDARSIPSCSIFFGNRFAVVVETAHRKILIDAVSPFDI